MGGEDGAKDSTAYAIVHLCTCVLVLVIPGGRKASLVAINDLSPLQHSSTESWPVSELSSGHWEALDRNRFVLSDVFNVASSTPTVAAA